MRFTILLLVLTACSRAPLSAGQRSDLNQISAAAFLGEAFTVDLSSRALIRSRETVVEITAWNLGDAFAASFGAALASRGKAFIPFELDPGSVSAAMGVRESRWKKVEGKQSQALLNLLFDSAQRRGIHYFLLLTPEPGHEAFPTFRGVMGSTCVAEGARARAFVYFFARASLWSVAGRKKIFEREIDPSFTQSTSYAECSVAAGIADPQLSLEDPAKRTLGHVAQELAASLFP